MQIIFDTTNKQDLNILEVLFKNLDNNWLKPEQSAQPEVAGNTGSTATGVSSLSPEGSGVSAEGAAPAASSAAPEKAKRTRKPKEDAPEVKSGGEYVPADPEPEPAPAPAADPATFTLDEVRAALQTFTAAKGVPAGIELLKKFNAGRISELAEENYASFVAECQA